MNQSIKKLLAEFIGTFTFLLAVAGTTAAANTTAAIPANRPIAIALVLGLMILTLGGISGGHFNPVVSLYFFINKQLSFSMLVAYVLAQLTAGFLGMLLGLWLWGLEISSPYSGNQVIPQNFVAELIATAGLVFVIGILVRNRQTKLIWIAVAIWGFASSTFAFVDGMGNPVVTFGLMFHGLQTGSVSLIMIAQLTGLAVAVILLLITGAKVKEKPVVSEPAVFEPVSFEPAVSESVVSEPVTFERLTFERVTSEPAAFEPTAFEPAPSEPAAFKPTAFEPVSPEHSAFESADEISFEEFDTPVKKPRFKKYRWKKSD